MLSKKLLSKKNIKGQFSFEIETRLCQYRLEPFSWFRSLARTPLIFRIQLRIQGFYVLCLAYLSFHGIVRVLVQYLYRKSSFYLHVLLGSVCIMRFGYFWLCSWIRNSRDVVAIFHWSRDYSLLRYGPDPVCFCTRRTLCNIQSPLLYNSLCRQGKFYNQGLRNLSLETDLTCKVAV